MSKTAQDYKVTFGYGATGAPYGTKENPYHRGEDRAMPQGTPVLVNGVQIGLSGMTGWADGPHLHVGRFVNGKDTNPGGGGFSFKNAEVTEINEDSVNGKYVRVQADGASWVYLHLDKKTAKVGQKLVAPEPAAAPAKKSNDAIAKEVVAGKWGNGDDRKKKLKAAGYDYNAVQSLVNKLVATPKPATKQYYTT